MANPIVLCEYCSKEIKRPKINQKFHKPCHIEYRRIYKREKEKQYYKRENLGKSERPCKSCGENFKAKHGNQKYCFECKINWRARIKGFSSKYEEISFKSKECPNCDNPLVYDAHLDTYKCLNCGYHRRSPTPVKSDSYPRLKLFDSGHGYPYDVDFQKIRGRSQTQYNHSSRESDDISSYDVVSLDDAFCDGCGMLKGRCKCEGTVQKIKKKYILKTKEN